MTTIGKVLFDVHLSLKERAAIERITGGRVLKLATLEVLVEVKVEGPKTKSAIQTPTAR